MGLPLVIVHQVFNQAGPAGCAGTAATGTGTGTGAWTGAADFCQAGGAELEVGVVAAGRLAGCCHAG
jgi:hypothetical protein